MVHAKEKFSSVGIFIIDCNLFPPSNRNLHCELLTAEQNVIWWVDQPRTVAWKMSGIFRSLPQVVESINIPYVRYESVPLRTRQQHCLIFCTRVCTVSAAHTSLEQSITATLALQCCVRQPGVSEQTPSPLCHS